MKRFLSAETLSFSFTASSKDLFVQLALIVFLPLTAQAEIVEYPLSRSYGNIGYWYQMAGAHFRVSYVVTGEVTVDTTSQPQKPASLCWS